jgi:hypothetical protein
MSSTDLLAANHWGRARTGRPLQLTDPARRQGHRATPHSPPGTYESHAGSRDHGPGAHLTTGAALEQRRQTSGDALKGAGRVGRAAFTAALRRWHLVILAGDVYRGNVGRRTLWVQALPSHSYQCASRPRWPGLRPPSAHALSQGGRASCPGMSGVRFIRFQHPGGLDMQGFGCGGSPRVSGLASGLALAVRPAGLAEAPALKGGSRRSFLRSG